MKLLIAAYPQEDSGCDCNAFVADIGEKAKADILARREIFQMAKSRAPDLNEMTFWLCHGEFQEWLDVDDVLDEESEEHDLFEDNGWAFLPEGVEVGDGDEDDDVLRTECDKLVITESGFYYAALWKHTDVAVETHEVPYEALFGKEAVS